MPNNHIEDDEIRFEDLPEDAQKAIQDIANVFAEVMEKDFEKFIIDKAHLETKH